jgi:3-polyprenyl-4-hydroxybenzoate decarboxylase
VEVIELLWIMAIRAACSPRNEVIFSPFPVIFNENKEIVLSEAKKVMHSYPSSSPLILIKLLIVISDDDDVHDVHDDVHDVHDDDDVCMIKMIIGFCFS